MDFITRAKPGSTGAERAKHRLAQKQAILGSIPATKETRQNYRSMLRKADKMAKAAARKAGVKV